MAPAIPSQLLISKVHKAFDDDGKLLGESYERRFSRFIDEFEWYVSALAGQRDLVYAALLIMPGHWYLELPCRFLQCNPLQRHLQIHQSLNPDF